MKVLKRTNTLEDISFDKVLRRLRKLCDEGVQLPTISPDEIAQRVCARIYDGVKTSELDELAAQMCASLVTVHPDYGVLASRIVISNHHKNTSPSFSETISILANAKDIHGNVNPLISDELINIVKAHKEKLNNVIDYQRDYTIDYFGFKTLERAYLMRINDKPVERPQDMWMRVALGIHGYDIKEALETYDLMSKRFFTHATPTLFNAGTPRPQLSSCYLLSTHDSVEGMYKTLADCAQISKYAGGIGVHIHTIRARGSHIRGTNGTSSGIIPMLRVFNNSARHINQAGKRNGSIAIYLEPWHADIEAFLDIRKNNGSEEDRCRDLFSAMWIPDLFMERVHANGDWSLMCPDTCPGLSDVVGDEFTKLYTYYEQSGKYRKKVKAQTIWMAIIKSQIETGTPYLCYKDAANIKSNQKNIGIIKSSNLCVAPETKILTSQGNKTIKDLVNKEVSVWNGTEWSNTTIIKTSDSSELIKITFSNNSILECTLYHKFHIEETDSQSQSQSQSQSHNIIKTASELQIGDKLISWMTPVHTNNIFNSLWEFTNELYYGNSDLNANDIIENITVKSIERTGRVDETYCFNEPLRHMGIFNGIIAGNCSEIIEYSDDNSYAVCNLASISLPAFVEVDSETGTKTFNLERLHKVSQIITRNLNKVIDRTFYPVPETRNSNLKHRPIGLGVQGLADVYAMLRYAFDSPEAAKLNRDIFETIYHGALTASVAIAKKRSELFDEMDAIRDSYKVPNPEFDKVNRVSFNKNYFALTLDEMNAISESYKVPNPESDKSDKVKRACYIKNYLALTLDECNLTTYRGAYSTFAGSPASQGLLQFDLWNKQPENNWDWIALKAEIAKYGLRNSLLLAPMPTASTSQILGNTECFEPITSNIFQRQTLAGEFTIINKHLIADLLELDLWNIEMKDRILAGGGSIQHIAEIPQEIKILYKTAWEIKQKVLIDQAAERGIYVCQSQSLNLFVEDPDISKLSNMHFYAWRAGLKTGCYYLRTRPKAKISAYTLEPPKQVVIESVKKENMTDEEMAKMVCRRDNPEACVMCSG